MPRPEGGRCSSIASPLTPRRQFDDLGLEGAPTRSLRALADRVRGARAADDRWQYRDRRRHLALIVGTSRGQHLAAAEAIANELGRNLLRVDLAELIDRWSTETDRSLTLLLESAAESGVVLLFDEADALFGRRTGDRPEAGNDRPDAGVASNAAHEVLEHLRAFSGFALLASDSAACFDAPLTRSLESIVELGPPVAES